MPIDSIVLALNTMLLPAMAGGMLRGFVGVSKSLKTGKKMNGWYFISFVLLSSVVGVFAGAIIGGSWTISFLAGYAGSDLLESLYKYRLLKFTKFGKG